jgi:undecaprenyl-diphosphatase
MPFELRARGWLSRHPAFAVISIVLGVLIFALLSWQLQTKGPMVQWDTQLAATLHQMAVKTPSPILEFLTYGFFLGKEDLQLLGAILIVYFLHKRFWPELGMVVFGWMGGSLIWNELIHYFNRARPQQQLGIEVRIASYPSGHSMFTALALGLLAYLLIPNMPSRFWKWAVGVVILVIILFVGGSRVYEGGHYLSDVIAGYAVAAAWGAFVYTLMDWIAVRSRRE